MPDKFNLFGVNLPSEVSGHHYAVTIISGLCTIAATAAGAYIFSRGQKPRLRKRRKKVASSKDELQTENTDSKTRQENGQ